MWLVKELHVEPRNLAPDTSSNHGAPRGCVSVSMPPIIWSYLHNQTDQVFAQLCDITESGYTHFEKMHKDFFS